MRILPRSISPVTIWGGIVTVIIVWLIALGPGNKYAISFGLPLAGPFGFMFFVTGLNDWIPRAPDISILYCVKIIMGSLVLGIGCLAMIFSHSYSRSGWCVLLTVIGYFLWIVFGLSVTYVSV